MRKRAATLAVVIVIAVLVGCAHPGPGLPPCKGNGDPSDQPGVNCRIVFTQAPAPKPDDFQRRTR